MKTVKILNEKQAEIDGVTYPIRKAGDTYSVYIADETLYGRHWIVIGKNIADYVATAITFDETKTSVMLGVPSGTKTPRITIEKLLEVLDEETSQKVKDAIDKIIADSKAEREKAIKANKIAKYQAMIDALMAE